MISVNLEVSNKEDWTIQFSAIDEDTGDDIDFTGASVAFELRDKNNCTLLTASTTAGTITLPTIDTVQIAFTADQMGALCTGSYPIGCVYELNSTTSQLFTGFASIYEGFASL